MLARVTISVKSIGYKKRLSILALPFKVTASVPIYGADFTKVSMRLGASLRPPPVLGPIYEHEPPFRVVPQVDRP